MFVTDTLHFVEGSSDAIVRDVDANNCAFSALFREEICMINHASVFVSVSSTSISTSIIRFINGFFLFVANKETAVNLILFVGNDAGIERKSLTR